MATRTAYFGKVCVKHLEAGGARTAQGNCCACSKDSSKKYRQSHPEKAKAASTRWRMNNPDYYKNKWKGREKYLIKRRVKHRARKTGFSEELFKRTLLVQGHACAVCERLFSEALKPHADHCHDSNVPRGVLCSGCNWAEGLIRKSGLDPEEFGARLRAYLQDPPALIAEIV